jgi:histone deacetylase 11
MLACRLALEHGIAINLGGGFHHAAANWGSGFCVYADAALGSAILHNEGLIERVLVIDLDAHQGNGTASVFQGWPWASILDLYQETLFPRHKEPEDYPIPVAGGMKGPEYLDLVREFVPKTLDAVRPNLIIYNAGSDPYEGDLRTGFSLALQDLVERDLLVVGMARERKVPVAMVLSGGFSVDSWRIHAESIAGIVGRFE